MAKKSPKPRPQTTEPAPAKDGPRPPDVKKQPLPYDAMKRMIKFYQDNHEEERLIWRSIYG